MSYLLHGKLQAKPGEGKHLAEILLEASRLMSTAPGCTFYIVSTDPQNDTDVWITELWAGKEDHDQSLKLPGVKELISTALPLLSGEPQKGQELTILGGHGV